MNDSEYSILKLLVFGKTLVNNFNERELSAFNDLKAKGMARSVLSKDIKSGIFQEYAKITDYGLLEHEHKTLSRDGLCRMGLGKQLSEAKEQVMWDKEDSSRLSDDDLNFLNMVRCGNNKMDAFESNQLEILQKLIERRIVFVRKHGVGEQRVYLSMNWMANSALNSFSSSDKVDPPKTDRPIKLTDQMINILEQSLSLKIPMEKYTVDAQNCILELVNLGLMYVYVFKKDGSKTICNFAGVSLKGWHALNASKDVMAKILDDSNKYKILDTVYSRRTTTNSLAKDFEQNTIDSLILAGYLTVVYCRSLLGEPSECLNLTEKGLKRLNYYEVESMRLK